jgi:hypothetical protein
LYLFSRSVIAFSAFSTNFDGGTATISRRDDPESICLVWFVVYECGWSSGFLAGLLRHNNQPTNANQQQTTEQTTTTPSCTMVQLSTKKGKGNWIMSNNPLFIKNGTSRANVKAKPGGAGASPGGGDGAGASAEVTPFSESETEEEPLPPHVVVTKKMVTESKSKGVKSLQDIINEHVVALREAEGLGHSAVVVVVTEEMQHAARASARKAFKRHGWSGFDEAEKVSEAEPFLHSLIHKKAAEAGQKAAEAGQKAAEAGQKAAEAREEEAKTELAAREATGTCGRSFVGTGLVDWSAATWCVM